MRMQFFCAVMAAPIILAGSFSKAAAPQAPVMKMSSHVSLFDASRSPAATSIGTNIQKELDQFLETSAKKQNKKHDWEVKADGMIAFDKKIWTVTKEADGGEIFVHKNGSEQKRTVIRNNDQSIGTVSEYKIENGKESFWFVFFLDQKLAAATTCTNETSDGLRACVTAIPSVCNSLPKSLTQSWTLPKPAIPDVDLVEKRAIATVVSMRGDQHQIENMAKTGNLIGLKDKMQTTRGRLTTAPVKSEFIQEVSALCSRARLHDGI